MDLFVRGGYQEPRDLLALAPLVEELGFAGITVPDHVVSPLHPTVGYPATDDGVPPYEIDTVWPDVWVLIGALAAVTTRLRFRTSIYVLPLRHPLVVAKAVGTAAVISGGRVELGIGVGHQRDEFDALGVPFAERGGRTDEAIDLLRAVLRPGPVEHHGRWFDLPPAYVHPAPAEPVPILVGGASAAAHRRAATRGDGYISFPLPAEELGRLAAHLQELRAEVADRPPLGIHGICTDAVTAEDHAAVADLGVTSLTVTPWGDAYHPPPLAAREEALRRFAGEVLEPLAELSTVRAGGAR